MFNALWAVGDEKEQDSLCWLLQSPADNYEQWMKMCLGYIIRRNLMETLGSLLL